MLHRLHPPTLRPLLRLARDGRAFGWAHTRERMGGPSLGRGRGFTAGTSAALYHVSGWPELADLGPGDAFLLRPGPQGAEGPGVYFSEGHYRLTAAEGARGVPQAIVEIEAPSTRGWWRTKASIARKFGRPVTWHTDGKALSAIVVERREAAGVPLLACAWEWA